VRLHLSVLLLSRRGTGEVVHLEEEFRLLTLQVIGEAILSLPPEECDRVSVPGRRSRITQLLMLFNVTSAPFLKRSDCWLAARELFD